MERSRALQTAQDGLRNFAVDDDGHGLVNLFLDHGLPLARGVGDRDGTFLPNGTSFIIPAVT